MIECIDLAFDHILLPPVSSRKRSRESDGDEDEDVDASNNNNNVLNTEAVVCAVIEPSAGSSSGKYRCLHNRNKYKCKDCGGGGICQHQRVRSRCKDCGGSEICQHQRRKSQCKDCGGAGICQHHRQRSQCKDCGGSGICQHQRQRNKCKDCGGGSICQHQRRRSSCKDCGGGGICQHQRVRSRCKDCGGSQICQHQILTKLTQRQSSRCQHQRVRIQCKDCGGGGICQHQRERSECISCQLYDIYEGIGLEQLSALFKSSNFSQVDKIYILRVIADKITRSCTKKSSSAFLPYFFDNYKSLNMNDAIDETFEGMITWLRDNENDET